MMYKQNFYQINIPYQNIILITYHYIINMIAIAIEILGIL